MDWQQKFAAIKSLAGGATLNMRKPEDWYVSASMSLGGDGMLRGVYGNGRTPEEAVNEHFRIYCEECPPNLYAVARAGGKDLRAVWTGFMWQTLPDQTDQPS